MPLTRISYCCHRFDWFFLYWDSNIITSLRVSGVHIGECGVTWRCFSCTHLLAPSSKQTTRWQTIICSFSVVNHKQWTYATGRERKEDGKPCVTNVTIILFEITLRQTSLSFKQMFLQRPENINVLWGSRHNKQVTALSCAFCRPLMSAVLLRKLTNVPHEWSPITVNKRHRGTTWCKTAQNVSSRCPLQSDIEQIQNLFLMRQSLQAGLKR